MGIRPFNEDRALRAMAGACTVPMAPEDVLVLGRQDLGDDLVAAVNAALPPSAFLGRTYLSDYSARDIESRAEVVVGHITRNRNRSTALGAVFELDRNQAPAVKVRHGTPRRFHAW